MAEDDNVSLQLIGQSLHRLIEGMSEVKRTLAAQAARIENIDATVTRMHADVVDAKATGKEVALRLTLVEHRLGEIDNRLDRIDGHLGLVDA
jgi:hypothetical protein